MTIRGVTTFGGDAISRPLRARTVDDNDRANLGTYSCDHIENLIPQAKAGNAKSFGGLRPVSCNESAGLPRETATFRFLAIAERTQ